MFVISLNVSIKIKTDTLLSSDLQLRQSPISISFLSLVMVSPTDIILSIDYVITIDSHFCTCFDCTLLTYKTACCISKKKCTAHVQKTHQICWKTFGTVSASKVPGQTKCYLQNYKTNHKSAFPFIRIISHTNQIPQSHGHVNAGIKSWSN